MTGKEFLFYIDFRNDLLRPFYTFLGGVRTTNYESTKTLVETADYVKDHRMYVAGSGVQNVTITLTGILENYQTQFDLLFKAHNNSELLKCRLDSGQRGFSIDGQFFIESLSADTEANIENSYTLTLVNSGEVVVTKND